MTEVPSPQLRISDQNRESALSALGEHMSAGRIDIDEYGERSARITAAKTRGELAEIFADLPAPHPRYEDVPQAVAAPEPAAAPPEPARPRTPDNWSPPQRFLAAIVPLAFIAAIALIATGTLAWPIIFVPIGLTVFGKSMWGHDWNHDQHHRDRRERHLRDRERRRELRDSYRRELGR
ncbi:MULTISPECIES: DUF1707 SHOCT-like domain-containing protein [unclassified Amycolatopsis]|uniref:DUF1707 SHOCT-like domain-containing protein n=1 Tax=unclassified Amycolatopsis TaxID=2618356 RepID=UPI002873FFAA|nr:MULTISPECIES: DUF1707 domain-containing protein [unclassified Amycolatopsis]MDS0135202.1 DUF1707 domain-containing protein [Amycolatopsis sp. 505]MDS0143021.1 DUF1707 domain-containing protein [Amycolatopsis sp. CM201R]